MSTEHCPDCNPGPLSEWKNNRCGAGHLYVKEFGPGYVEKYPERKSYKGCLYVGSTTKTVMKRHDENWTKYKSPNAKDIREFCDRYNPTFRYDLITKDRYQNPIQLGEGDRGRYNLEVWEVGLADNLKNRGYWVEGGKRKPSC